MRPDMQASTMPRHAPAMPPPCMPHLHERPWYSFSGVTLLMIWLYSDIILHTGEGVGQAVGV